MSVMIKQLKPDPDAILMGLEKEELSCFPECESTFEIPFVYGRPNIGLDGKDDKKLKEKFEQFFNVKFDTPEGLKWLSEYEVTIKHDVTAYDQRNPKDAFDLHILKVNGGMGFVATSTVAVENTPVNTFKFIITDDQSELEERVRTRETKLAASEELRKLYEGNTNRLVLVAKYLFSTNAGIGTSKIMAFDKVAEFIDKSTANQKMFLDVVKIDPSHLETVVKIKEAIYRNIVRYNNGQYMIHATQTPVGRSEDEVIKFFTDPKNKDLLGYGLSDDSPTSISAQLKQYLDN